MNEQHTETIETKQEAVLPAVARTLNTLSDGTVRLRIDFEPRDREVAMRLFGEPGSAIAVARLTVEAAQQQLQQQMAAPFGELAKTLRLSSFFRTTNVWAKIGQDKDFLAWLRQQPCAYCKAKPSQHAPTQAAHVRRVANGSGTAIKPAYSAIPLCHSHHALQHQQGESALGGKEWFDRQRITHLAHWGWQTLKQRLGHASWSQVPPEVLRQWAMNNHVDQYLPQEYRA